MDGARGCPAARKLTCMVGFFPSGNPVEYGSRVLLKGDDNPRRTIVRGRFPLPGVPAPLVGRGIIGRDKTF